MNVLVDCMGMTCPIPVVETRKVLKTAEEGDILEVLVDNRTSVENLEKMARQMGLQSWPETVADGEYVVRIEAATTAGGRSCASMSFGEGTVVVVPSDKLGEGDERLGRTLMKGFLYALLEQDELPTAVLFYNAGAKLTTVDSESLADIRSLAERGVEILTCGTCLNHYDLTEKLAVGSITNMYTICEKQMSAGRLVKL